MAAEFYDASKELIDIAHELIQEHHEHLIEAKIKYLFRTGNWEAKKRETWGQAKKVGKEVNFLTGYDFIIMIHRDVWEQLNEEEKKALLDHELQHCSAGTDDAGNKIWYIQGHDVEDFYAIIRRHGLWSKMLRKMESLLNQTELSFEQSSQTEQFPELTGEALRELPSRPTLQISRSQPIKALPDPDELTPDSDDTDQNDDDIIDIEVIRDTETAG